MKGELQAHDWDEGFIVGYLPQSEPEWVTRFGYRPPVRKYTCKKCGQTLNGATGGLLTYQLMLKDCPGFKARP